MNGRAGLILEGVSAGYGDTVVLEGISLALAPGEAKSISDTTVAAKCNPTVR